MDNEAFRALVQERATAKTTKEIAREAVEEEFAWKKKKRKRGGSSSEEEGSGDDSTEEKGKQDFLVPVAAQKKRPKTEQYRDRAKERREGKNVDYAAAASLLEGIEASAQDCDMDQATLSKYLGGDEAHTYLVKGLDVALARKVKSEMGVTKDQDDLDTLMDDAVKEKAKKEHVVVKDIHEARSFLERLDPKSLSSELGEKMLEYLKSKSLPPPSQCHARKSPAGFVIQRSTMTFATTGDPLDKSRAWEVPLESTQAASHVGTAIEEETTGATLLDAILLEKINAALTEKRPRQKNEIDDSIKADKNVDEQAEERRSEMNAEADDDSDDDIFGDIGAYVPTSSAKSEKRSTIAGEDSLKEKKGSIFDQVVPKASPSRPVVHVRAALPAAARPVHGTALSSYEGGYGEEIDVDFDCRFAAEEEEIDGKKGRKEETTLAALEYGAGRAKKDKTGN